MRGMIFAGVFLQAAGTGLANVDVIWAPVDFRRGNRVPEAVKLPVWTEGLYAQARTRLGELPLP